MTNLPALHWTVRSITRNKLLNTIYWLYPQSPPYYDYHTGCWNVSQLSFPGLHWPRWSSYYTYSVLIICLCRNKINIIPLYMALSHYSLKLFCRQDSEYIKEVIKPFDWTFTTDYRGTLTGKKGIIMKVTLNWSLSIMKWSQHM